MKLQPSKIFIALFLAVALTGCSESTTSQGAPTPTDPNAAPSDFNVPPATQDPNIPDLTGSVPVHLPVLSNGSTNYQPLIDLSGGFYPPMVGDFRFVLKSVSSDRNTGAFHATARFGFEDDAGWWGADIKEVPHAGVRQFVNNQDRIDIVFSDPIPSAPNYQWGNYPYITIRMVAVVENGLARGSLYYRIRNKANEVQDNQCISNLNPQCHWSWSSSYCESYKTNYKINMANQCRSGYMAIPSGSSNTIKVLGDYESLRLSN